ncbi:homeobox-leucine zipper protein HOX11-like [Gastrolobium bilobum]|uniref:homeobox-leucine zipper protein HOX11-like n=1 Tax=Gastrolobium bilobum TaxID=150636 RepID=UPI002AB1D894|nr:homeobox-leucine zipper protein HOX11-like [Gastrolobium bilobum]
MELALSLGDTPKHFTFIEPSFTAGKTIEEKRNACERNGSLDPPVQLDLLPFSPVLRSQPSSQLRIPWLNESCGPARVLDVNLFPVAAAAEDADDGTSLSSSPNSAVSPFQMDFSVRNNGNAEDGGRNKRENEGEAERASSRASDDDENGSTRKKLRLSKEQSAFLEESFKEHTTLNPKQKLALAKQLNLRPRQVEVWFQNRRARTKLKQTEVDCEYLKRCCETLTEENRRLQKELQELRALKTSQPFYMQLPATTLTMCPSCERVATNSCTGGAAAATNKTSTANAATNNGSQTPLGLSLSKPRILPFPNAQAQAQAQAHQMAS